MIEVGFSLGTPFTSKHLIKWLNGAYNYCVKQSQSCGDCWDEASLTLIVRIEHMKGDSCAAALILREEKDVKR